MGKRLSRWLAVQVLVSFVLVSLVVYFVIANHLASRQFSGLQEKQVLIEHMLEEFRQNPVLGDLRHQLDDFLAGHNELQVVVDHEDGPVVYAGKRGFPVNEDVQTLMFEAVGFDNGGRPARVAISVDRHADDELLHRLAFTLIIASLLATMAVVRGVYWVVNREMRSVDSLVDQINRLTASTLESRLKGEALPAELLPLVAQFNDLLERLSLSYSQLESFNADVAHELNTPLTNLITNSELALRQCNGNQVDASVLGSNLEELHRMSEIIRSMMFLSKAERGSVARCERVASVARIALEVVDYHDAVLSESDLRVTLTGDSAAYLDVALLKRALSNLLGNACVYATTGSEIDMHISSDSDGFVRLTVCNRGPTIPAEEIALIFNRFYRSDSARSLSDRHHGLGLSIVAAIANMHGGQTFATSENGVTCIGLTFSG